MIRVLIADDHIILREGVKWILSRCPDIRVEGEASTGLQAFQMISRGSWDVAILEIAIAGRNNGLEILRELRKLGDRTPVLMLTVHPADQFGAQAMRAGAAGYLSKNTQSEELVRAVRKVAGGGRYINESLAEQILDGMNDDLEPRHDALSQREFEVFAGMAAGKTTAQIAQELTLSVKTVSTYRTRALEKLKLRNNAELVYYAAQHGFIPRLSSTTPAAAEQRTQDISGDHTGPRPTRARPQRSLSATARNGQPSVRAD